MLTIMVVAYMLETIDIKRTTVTVFFLNMTKTRANHNLDRINAKSFRDFCRCLKLNEGHYQ